MDKIETATLDTEEILWPVPPAERTLGAAVVHVWAAPLDAPEAALDNFAATLAQDECNRAARFHFERDRNRFIAGRGALRSILGDYLQIDPGKLKFAYGPRGKPCLV